MVRFLYSEQSVLFKKNCLNCKSRNGSEKKTQQSETRLYSSKCSSPITCLSVYAINQCWCHVKLQKPKFKFAQFNYPYFKTKHEHCIYLPQDCSAGTRNRTCYA